MSSKINTACTSENEYALLDTEAREEIERAKEWACEMSQLQENEDEKEGFGNTAIPLR